MGWSKSTRIKVMLVIDVMFFLLELIVGFAVGSLALMADAFHMLNDIISLLVGLWAVSVAQKATTDRFSYGWVRAEILGAFFNAVFLIALCVSIVLEAVARFVDPPPISNPQLILIVGCMGLASNLVGFVVLGGHGHSHGPGDHDHGHEHGDGHSHTHEADGATAEEGRAGYRDLASPINEEPPTLGTESSRGNIRFSTESHSRQGSRSGHKKRLQAARQHPRLSIDDISIHPASFRQEIIAATRAQADDESSTGSTTEDESALLDTPALEEQPLLERSDDTVTTEEVHAPDAHGRRPRRNSAVHISHNHNKPRKPGKKHGHSHGDMGMDAMVLHVLGDALGNVGVIVTALIIWLTDWPGKFYTDPAVSLFITVIILKSAIPLTKATSKVLLQATPENIDLQEVKEDIQALPGVVSCHHVHIWQLSDTKIVASMHIKVAFPLTEAGGARYMEVARMARKCLHAYGIHSATIQPEFCLDEAHDHESVVNMGLDGSTVIAAPRCGELEEDACLLDCVDDCVGKGCCSASVPGSRPESRRSHSHSDHGHDHSHDHSHEHRH
ncbi:cation efflux protein [Apiosordaria backusii]|uniref:Cation efflux protein n=1 Tax=Apiosordaria backusii TaxID=314023 RepID=A0AA40B837_9PEZI|nr:cation efflux protein [Apiosordaria backusii]